MVHGADDIPQDIKDARQDIADTRSTMTEKLALLGERVLETVEGAQASMEKMVENVRDTVDTTVAAVKETIEGTQASVEGMVKNVKGTVGETVETVQRTFDPSHQMDRHPWLMFGGATLVGYLLGNLGGSRTSAVSTHNRRLSPASLTPASSNGSFPRPQPRRGIGSGVRERFKDEIVIIESAAVGAVMNTLWGMLKQALPTVASHSESDTTERGGQPSDHPAQTPVAMSSAAINGSAILSIQGRE